MSNIIEKIEEWQSITNENIFESIPQDQIRVIQKKAKKLLNKSKVSKLTTDIKMLRLYLAEMELIKHNHIIAAKKYQSILRSDKECIDAMIGIAESYLLICKYNKAMIWLKKALDSARSQKAQNKELDILNTMLVLVEKNEIINILSEMNRVVKDNYQGEYIPTAGVSVIMDLGFGEYTVNYLESGIKWQIRNQDNKSPGYLYILTRCYVNACRQASIEDSDILNNFNSFAALAIDEVTSKIYAHSIERAFKVGSYPE